MNVKSKISIKIFLLLMVSFLVILAVSTKINLQNQINLQKNNHLNTVFNHNQFDELKEKINYDSQPTYQEVITQIEKLDQIGDNNFYQCIIDKNNQIIKWYSKSPYQDNYLCLDEKYYSLDKLSLKQRTSLRGYLIKQQQDIQYSIPGMVEIEYSENENELVYLKWDDNSYGKKQGNLKNAKMVSDYCIDGLKMIQSNYDYNVFLNDLNDVKTVIKNINSYGQEIMWLQSSNEMDYYISMLRLTNLEDQALYALMISVEKQDTITSYITDAYLDDNLGLYLVAFIIVVFISMLSAFSISKPIKKIEQAALKIKDNYFDVPLEINRHDEIGSLANSINAMAKQLKETIEQLNQEIKQVKKLENLRTNFINQFTHEMKTPISIVSGYSELISETENEQDKLKYLNIINREIQRINQLVESMLSLSRLEAKKVQLNIQTWNLEDSVREIIDEYDVLFMKKDITVNLEIKDVMIKADKKLIETVIHNFLSNALKHTEAKGKIIIYLDHGLAVYNSGSLIPKEQINDIWYSFVTHDYQGSGLGLAICKSILELHHFDYGVKNCQDGVKFYFKTKNK